MDEKSQTSNQTRTSAIVVIRQDERHTSGLRGEYNALHGRNMKKARSSGNDYEAFLRRIRAMGPDDRTTYITASRVLLPQVLVHELRAAEDLATAMYVLGAHVWSEPAGEFEGLEILRTAASLGSAEATRSLGDALNWIGLYEESVPILEAALRSDPGDPRLHGLLGLSLYELHLEKEAQPHLRIGLRVDSSLAIPLAHVRRGVGDEAEYQKLILEAVQSQVYGAHVLAGNLLAEQGDKDHAADLYRQGITSGDAHSAYNLACLLYEGGKLDEARDKFQLAREMGDLRLSPFERSES
ncbi:tetratricopeptide repeat protein [Microbacterium testaceum]|uniref:tetratricopeptide repeat protein n=1 Tax=Microbacterium testaceum TaxID=2033 RepID=UPI00128EB5F7|nr:tetratricopeptide repeat protein [Microbacterium testaceum]